MANGAAKVNFNLKDNTQFTSTPNVGLHFILGVSKRGEINKPNKIYNNWENWVEDYGGLYNNLDTPKLVKTLLEGGSSIRFSKVVANDENGQPLSKPATAKILLEVEEGEEALPLFFLETKGQGSDYNNLVASVTFEPNSDTFNLNVEHIVEGEIFVSEQYDNILIPKSAEELINNLAPLNNSNIFTVLYNSEVDYNNPLKLLLNDNKFEGGLDSPSPTVADFIGDSSTNSGLHSFDAYEDSMQLAAFDMYSSDFYVALSNYTDFRKDLIGYAYLTGNTKESLISNRSPVSSNAYIQFIGGDGLVTDLTTGNQSPTQPIADVLNNIAASDREYGPWYSYAGPNRGIIRRFIDVINNFGTKAKLSDLDELANNQINMVINRGSRIMLWGNISGQTKQTQLTQISVLRLCIHIKKTIVPTLEEFIDEPNMPSTWKRLYYVVKPFLDDLIDSRAILSYRWEGDQFTNNPDEWKVNKPSDVQNGKYKVKLFITAISAIREIELELGLEDYNVEFNIVG